MTESEARYPRTPHPLLSVPQRYLVASHINGEYIIFSFDN